jgi:flagellar motor switch protein FliM
MSEAILSEEQIAALVAAAQQGQAPAAAGADAGPKRRPRRVREIDFSRPNKFPQDQQRRLERAHELFCRTAAGRLSAELLMPVEIEVLGVDQLTWSSATGQIPHPSICAILTGRPIDTQVLLTAELPLVLRMVERMLGGTGTTRPQQRDLTEIELSLVRRIYATLLGPLSATWEELAGVTLELQDIEAQMANANLAPPSEPTLLLTMEVRIGQGSQTLSLVIPHRSIEPVADALSAGQYGEADVDPAAADALQAGLAEVDVEVRAEVASRTMSVGDVLALGPGDVIRFGVPASAGVTVFAGHVPAHRAQAGRNGRRRAVQILDRLEPS